MLKMFELKSIFFNILYGGDKNTLYQQKVRELNFMENCFIFFLKNIHVLAGQIEQSIEPILTSVSKRRSLEIHRHVRQNRFGRLFVTDPFSNR